MKWTAPMDSLLRAEYPSGNLEALCVSLGVTRSQIRHRAQRIGIRRIVTTDDRQARGELGRTERVPDTSGLHLKALSARTELEIAWSGSCPD